MNDGNNSLDLLALTEEQKKEILKVVYEADTESGKKLEDAMKETESSDYEDITVQNDNSELVGIDTTINETEIPTKIMVRTYVNQKPKIRYVSFGTLISPLELKKLLLFSPTSNGLILILKFL